MTTVDDCELTERYHQLVAKAAAGTLTDFERTNLRLFGAWLGKAAIDIGKDVVAALRTKTPQPEGNRLLSLPKHCQLTPPPRHGTNRVATDDDGGKTPNATECGVSQPAGNRRERPKP